MKRPARLFRTGLTLPPSPRSGGEAERGDDEGWEVRLVAEVEDAELLVGLRAPNHQAPDHDGAGPHLGVNGLSFRQSSAPVVHDDDEVDLLFLCQTSDLLADFRSCRVHVWISQVLHFFQPFEVNVVGDGNLSQSRVQQAHQIVGEVQNADLPRRHVLSSVSRLTNEPDKRYYTPL